MNIYEVIVYCLLLSTLFSIYGKQKWTQCTNYLYLFFICVLIYVASFRGLDIGTDTYNYHDSFINQYQSAHSDVIFDKWGLFCHNYLNYDWYMLLSYGMIIGCVGFVAKRLSPLPFFSIFLFTACEFYLVSFNAFRQYIAVAVSFIILYILETSLKWKWVKVTSLILINMFIHSSSLIILFVLLIYPFKIQKKYYTVAVLLSFIVGFFFTDFLNSYFIYFSMYLGDYASYFINSGDGERRLLTNLGMNVVFLLTLLFTDSKTKNSTLFKSLFISMLIFNMVGSKGWLTRLSDNLAIVQIILFPIVYQTINKKMLKLGYLVLIVFFALLRFYVKGISNPDVLPYYIRDGINLLP